jgi:hypothetical protein
MSFNRLRACLRAPTRQATLQIIIAGSLSWIGRKSLLQVLHGFHRLAYTARKH